MGDVIDDIDAERRNKIDWILWVHQLVWQLTVHTKFRLKTFSKRVSSIQSGVYFNRETTPYGNVDFAMTVSMGISTDIQVQEQAIQPHNPIDESDFGGLDRCIVWPTKQPMNQSNP